MREIILIVVVGIMNILCFYFGAKTGQKVINKEEVKILPDPVKAYQKHQAKKEQEKESEVMDTILHNIDAYDGTSIGQKEIPR